MDTLEKIEALTNENMIDSMLLDYQAFKLSMPWIHQFYIWRKWLNQS